MQDMKSIQGAIKDVENKISAACKRVGRNPEEVTLIAVSKTMPVEAIREAMECGMIEFGENRPQELCRRCKGRGFPYRQHQGL